MVIELLSVDGSILNLLVDEFLKIFLGFYLNEYKCLANLPSANVIEDEFRISINTTGQNHDFFNLSTPNLPGKFHYWPRIVGTFLVLRASIGSNSCKYFQYFFEFYRILI